jgi:hypothetical protein
MSEPLEVRVMVYNVREWKEFSDAERFMIAEHIIGIRGVPVGSTIKVCDEVRMPLRWDGFPVYEATATRYDTTGPLSKDDDFKAYFQRKDEKAVNDQ